jgi:hypothetical protein
LDIADRYSNVYGHLKRIFLSVFSFFFRLFSVIVMVRGVCSIVCCSYCGKVIGAFRLIRDEEFCSDLHRAKYGARLGKALHQISAPEPAPAGVAGFLDRMPFQQGNLRATLNLWLTVTSQNIVRNVAGWPLTIDTSDPTRNAANYVVPIVACPPVEVPPRSESWMSAPAAEPVAALVQASATLAPAWTQRAPRLAARLEATPVLDQARHTPDPCDNWMPAPAAEPVTAWVQASATLTPGQTQRAPCLAARLEATPVLDQARHAPDPCDNWMPAPAPEPVAALVQASATLALGQSVWMPRFAAELEPVSVPDEPLAPPAMCQQWMPAPAAEPVTALVQASATLAPAWTLRAPGLAARLEATLVLDKARHAPAPCDNWLPAPAPEPVTALVQASVHASVQASATLALGQSLWMPRFAAELEPLPVPDEPLAPPAMCQQWMLAPAVDPVSGSLQASIAPAVAVTRALTEPAGVLSSAVPQVPWIAQARPMPHAEAAVTAARPSAAEAPIHQAAAVALPAIPPAAREPFAAASPASPSQPEAVERLLVAAQAAVPVSMERAPCRGVEPGAPTPVFEPQPEIGKPVASPAPAAVESFLVASVAGPMPAAVHLPPFALSVSQESRIPSFEVQRLTAAASSPAAVAPRLEAPHPIATPAVMPPATDERPLEPALPRPGLQLIEYHSHRLHSAAAAHPEWRMPRPALLPPRFLLGPILEKLEEPAPRQNIARQEPGFAGLLHMPAAKRAPSVWMVAGRVAAGFLLAASLWFGVASFRGDHRLAAREEVSSGDTALSAANSASSATMSNGGTTAQPAPKGPVAWVRQTIANRAALRFADDFRGMENWDSAGKARPAGWSRHPDGYVNTGALALFRPTRNFTDYRMEFFGQIETKSIGWTVRATDTMNYHAMKLTVMEAGMRPFVALVHYDVVGGKAGRRTQTPLNVMVHNRTPMQFAVDVRGNRVVTSIDGEEVDSFVDNTLVAGGVGFFSEAGERARLYWMRVSRNDDWLGHVCAMLAKEAGATNTAGLRGPALPGGAPAPGLPASGDGMTLAAVWFGLPYLGANRKTRFLKTWRSEPWNT